jgi:hypothetical protein
MLASDRERKGDYMMSNFMICIAHQIVSPRGGKRGSYTDSFEKYKGDTESGKTRSRREDSINLLKPSGNLTYHQV